MSGDDWFKHDASEAPPQTEHGGHYSPTALGIALVGTVFGVLLVIVVLVIYFNSYQNQLKALRSDGTQSMAAYLSYRAKAEGELKGEPQWVDREAGTVRLPIERAKASVIAEYEDRRQTDAAPAGNEIPEIATVRTTGDTTDGDIPASDG